MSKVFLINDGKHSFKNTYWQSFAIIEEINKKDIKIREKLMLKINQIYKEYEFLSSKYQQNKIKNDIPLN